MENWQEILQQSITTPEGLAERLGCDINALPEVIANFPMRINPYFLNLVTAADDPLGKQVIPDKAELDDRVCIPDPLGEEELSPVPNLVHKYPDRVLFLVNNSCAVYCRFCTRKRMVGTPRMRTSKETLEQGYEYLKSHPEVREVLVSGGDPLLLSDTMLDEILGNLRKIPSIEIIRIGTRVPSVLPMRVTEDLVAVLKKYHPLYINTHFNHPREITEQSSLACTMLADAGIPLGCQTVLLKGVNDNIDTIKELMRGLLRIRVKPYYLFQADLTRGVDHFRTNTRVGIDIMKQLYSHLSGMAVPTFVLDAPGGKGKIPLTPDYIVSSSDKELVFENYQGKLCVYPEAGCSL
ncbi:KamA family radical SAM protein [Desulforhopalus singaporensis]|uniref:L-lysine 2,3-aminomutase n=1 Tax=Desulforhopalus singaporensis TaxID=91360 RepID=A0A1H0PFL7_9BACT|nr:KamA family radical SAM protein [Desulforhopalus singaporensis]SDP03445.1 L-lysine 2,3-aminomutase [Desulforhopalus singaporensis]